MSTSDWVESLLAHRPEELRLVVLSDIHVYHDEATLLGNSNYARDMSDHSISNNPVAALKELITSRGITADFLICPGDITDRAHPGALEHGWRLLHEIKDLVGAKAVLATPGNHDVDSRYGHTRYDAKGVAVNLSPDFPISHRQLADTFWARHFVMLEGGNYRIVLLNSAAYHGEGTVFPGDPSDKTPRPPPLPEYEHGRVSPNTLDAIEKLLKATDPKPVNILVCHHHPDRLSGARFESDYGAMQGGRELTDTLARPEYGRWVIIHGHKHLGAVHQPSCSTSPGPIAFCASAPAASARLYRETGLPVIRSTSCRFQRIRAATAWE
ncbi:MAG: metallophosphoesterase family protein [Actinomycetota bacterium]